MMPGCVTQEGVYTMRRVVCSVFVAMCVCVHACVYNIISLNTCEGSNVCACVCVCLFVCDSVCVHFIKRPTLLYMEGVWGQA